MPNHPDIINRSFAKIFRHVFVRDIKVVIGDSEGLPEKAKALMEKFITQDGVVAVGGGYHSSVGRIRRTPG